MVTHARDHWWTLDFANPFVSPGVNSRAELLPSPPAYARNGAARRWLGDDNVLLLLYGFFVKKDTSTFKRQMKFSNVSVLFSAVYTINL
jgi:hypothetical protein